MTLNGQHKENESNCRKVVEQLVSSIPHSVLVRALYKEKEQEIGTQKKTVTFEEPDHELIEVESKKPWVTEPPWASFCGKKLIRAQRNDRMTSNLKSWTKFCPGSLDR